MIKNKKGAENIIGLLVVVAIAIIVGAILLQASAQNVGDVVNTKDYANFSLADPTAGTAQYVTSCRSLTGVKIFNATNDIEVPSSNYTLTNNVLDPTTGGLSVNITPAVALNDTWSVGVWTIDGVCQPVTYESSSGGRAVAGLIAIFFGLAIAVVALTPVLRSGFMEMFGR